jgi:4-amino-4-deoxy-L-arabinose transferase-like glycosyltransferase
LVRGLAVPLLSTIPYIFNAADRRRAKRPVKWLLLAVVVGIASALAAIHFLWMPLEVFWYSLLRRLSLA